MGEDEPGPRERSRCPTATAEPRCRPTASTPTLPGLPVSSSHRRLPHRTAQPAGDQPAHRPGRAGRARRRGEEPPPPSASSTRSSSALEGTAENQIVVGGQVEDVDAAGLTTPPHCPGHPASQRARPPRCEKAISAAQRTPNPDKLPAMREGRRSFEIGLYTHPTCVPPSQLQNRQPSTSGQESQPASAESVQRRWNRLARIKQLRRKQRVTRAGDCLRPRSRSCARTASAVQRPRLSGIPGRHGSFPAFSGVRCRQW